MSVDLLRRAAAKLREHAEAVGASDTFTKDVPWEVEEDDDRDATLYVVANLTEFSTSYIGEGFLSRAHADFVALMHPPVALALAEWLEAQAADVENAVAAWSRDTGYIDKHLGGVEAHTGNMFRPSIAAARAILREPEVA